MEVLTNNFNDFFSIFFSMGPIRFDKEIKHLKFELKLVKSYLIKFELKLVKRSFD